MKIAMTEVKSLGVALVLCMLGHVTGTPRRDCGVDARPHDEGLCGEKLIRARDNLCFLLRIDYPTYFQSNPSKRSVDDLFNSPVHAFAEMNLFNDDEVTETTSSPRMYAANPFSLTKAKRTRWFHNSKRMNIRGGGMVCDCCYNKCTPSVLAQYC